MKIEIKGRLPIDEYFHPSPKLIEGDFLEGQYVTLLMLDGKTVKRKVYYNKKVGDLFVWYKGSQYFCYETIRL